MVCKSKCCGCGACVQSCPLKCIKMVEDNEGFLYPIIDKKICKNCGLCSTVCPIDKFNGVNNDCTKFPKAFVAYNTKESRLCSSSGGIFPLIAEQVINSGGSVFGAAWDENLSVHHVSIRNNKDLFLILGSKYVQSRIEKTYSQVKQELLSQKQVLFCGTGCQIAGLKSFLRNKEYSNLITIDILCHGVPSPKVLKKYLSEQENKHQSLVDKVNFRLKDGFEWEKYCVEIVFQNGDSLIELAEVNSYMKLFLNNICLRPSCYNCQFKSINRVSDITLGDAWGINDYMPEMNDGKGVSAVLIHTVKGKEIIDSISSHLCYRKIDPDILIPKDSDARKSVRKHEARKKFFKKLNLGATIDELVLLLKPSLSLRLKYKFGLKK